MLNERPQKDAPASDENRRIGTQIYLQFSELVQNISGVEVGIVSDRLFHVRRKNSFLAGEHGSDMLVLNQHIVQGVDLANDFVVHGNNAILKGTAELKIRFPVPEQKNVCRIAADIYNKEPWRTQHQRTVGDHGGICLGEYEDLVNSDAVLPVVVCKRNGAGFVEVFLEAAF